VAYANATKTTPSHPSPPKNNKIKMSHIGAVTSGGCSYVHFVRLFDIWPVSLLQNMTIRCASGQQINELICTNTRIPQQATLLHFHRYADPQDLHYKAEGYRPYCNFVKPLSRSPTDYGIPYWNSGFITVFTTPPLGVAVLSHCNSVQALKPYFLAMHSNITLPLIPRPSEFPSHL
jgi:hypothetical protein